MSDSPQMTPATATALPAEPASQPSAGARSRLTPDEPRVRYAGLAVVLLISGVLNLNRLSQNGFSNTFYSAGIRSMLDSLHNFVFVSFDPGGLVTVDKPPLALWVQAASAKLFGFTPLSLLLPEAIAGILAVGALYLILARRAGTLAAFAGALTMAVFPSFVAVSRDNGVDPLLILLMVLACGAGLRATETGRLALAARLRGARRAGLQHQDARGAPGCSRDRHRLPRRRPALAAAKDRPAGGCGHRDADRVLLVDRLRRTDPGIPAPIRRQFHQQHRARADLRIQRARPRRRPDRRARADTPWQRCARVGAAPHPSKLRNPRNRPKRSVAAKADG